MTATVIVTIEDKTGLEISSWLKSNSDVFITMSASGSISGLNKRYGGDE